MRKPIALILGIIGSIILLAIFMAIQSNQGSALSVPTPFLIVSLAPTLIGLAVGNYFYFRRIKIAGVIDAEIEKLPEAPQQKPLPNSAPVSAQWQSARAEEYARTNHYMLSHVYRPSTVKGQVFDIFIFLVRHQKGTSTPPQRNFEEIEKVEFFFGDSWGNKTFAVTNEGKVIGVQTHAWGTFLATCRITFKDYEKTPIVLHRYIDFAMASERPEPA